MSWIKRNLMSAESWAKGLFWSWNLIFIAFMVFGFAPRILPDLITAVRADAIPGSFLVYALVLTAVPLAAVVLGLTLLRRAPTRLFALGYVVEGPLMLLLAIRFFIIREASPAATFIFGVAALGMAAFLWYVLSPEFEKSSTLAGWLRLVGLTLMLLISLYAAVWIAFYALPLLTLALQFIGDVLGDLPRFLREIWRTLVELFTQSLIWVPFAFLGFLLLLYTATLFVLTPLAVPILAVRAWGRSLASLAARRGWARPGLLVALVLISSLGLFNLVNRQPQAQAFALLEKPPATEADALVLLDREESIREGLLNAYLAPFRYISAVGEVTHVRTIYRDVFKLSEAQARDVQDAYEQVARPLLYSPVEPLKAGERQDNVALAREPQEAARLYRRFFDQPIVEGERPAIVHAVRATWSFDQAEAAWQAVDDREIHLIRQEVNVQEHNDWAEVELFEVYQNQTSDLQEVIYYFNLPESAALIGVWLGNSEDRDARFVYQVAPRGAAQAVYRNETRVMRDPALLEQIGPRQYRLRVYPVPGIRLDWDEARARTIFGEAPPLYMWMTYRVLAAGDAFPLPGLAFKRNVYWDQDTIRLLNGAPMAVEAEDWLPAAVEAASPVTPQAHLFEFSSGQQVVAVPVSQVDLPLLPTDLQLAVVLDRSRSMQDQADRVVSAIEQLKQTVGAGANVDVYLTASPYRGSAPTEVSLAEFRPEDVVYFGGQNAAELLAQYDAIRVGKDYDAILVMTDSSGYELGAVEIDVPIPSAQVWMVHLGGNIPLGYDDQTLEAIQASGGGVTGDLDEALGRMAAALVQDRNQAAAGESRTLLDGYLWQVLPEGSGDTLNVINLVEDTGFSALAARRLILAEIAWQRENLEALSTLDELHALAIANSIVTPYSSMIVLVEADQQEILDHLTQEGDRFEREFEDLADTTPATPLPLAGVPEPHEWLLLGLGVLLLIWYTTRQRYALQNHTIR
jgi:putative PEP-CTERM system integral membrane protein